MTKHAQMSCVRESREGPSNLQLPSSGPETPIWAFAVSLSSAAGRCLFFYFDAPFSEFDIDLVTRIQGHQQPADGPRPPPRKPSRLALTRYAVHAALAPAHRPMIASRAVCRAGEAFAIAHRHTRVPWAVAAAGSTASSVHREPALAFRALRTRNSRAIAEPCLGTRHLCPRRRVLFLLPCFSSALKLDQPPCLSDHSLSFPLSQPLPEPKEPFPAQANPQTHTQDKPANRDRPQ